MQAAAVGWNPLKARGIFPAFSRTCPAAPPSPTGTGGSMATDAVVLPASPPHPAYRRPNRTAERVFYSGMAVLMCVCVYIGFAPTYFRAGMLKAPLPSPILHVHGVVF